MSKESEFNIGDLYRQEAEESQKLIAELTSDVRLFAVPHEVVKKIDRLAEIWGIQHEQPKGNA